MQDACYIIPHNLSTKKELYKIRRTPDWKNCTVMQCRGGVKYNSTLTKNEQRSNLNDDDDDDDDDDDNNTEW